MKFWTRSAAASAAVFFVLVTGCVGQRNAHSAALVRNLDASQYFSLQDLSGKSVVLADLLKEKKAVLVNFFATWCPPCREEIPDLIRLQEKYSNQSFTVLGVNVGESQKKVSLFAEKMGMNFPIALDSENSVSRAYGIVGIPASLLISSSGKILGEYHAATEELFQDVEQALS